MNFDQNLYLNSTILLNSGKILLVLCFGISLVKSSRGDWSLETSFERLIVGLLVLSFYKPVLDGLIGVTESLTDYLTQYSKTKGLKELILNAFEKAYKADTPNKSHTSFNLPSFIEQAWRTGVWGIMTTLVEWVYLLSAFLLEVSREVFLSVLLFLFPLGCGVYPLFPRILENIALYAVELSLWFPCLMVIEITTADVAKKYLTKEGSLGLYIVATELVAVFLILMIPAITHRFLGGALSGDFDSGNNLILNAKKWIRNQKTKPWVTDEQ